MIGISLHEVLMVFLGGIESPELRHLGHDRLTEHLSVLKLLDVSFRDPLLLGVFPEDCRTVLFTPIRTLPVQLGGIVSDREKYLEKLPVGKLRRIEGNLDRFRVS